MLTVVLAVVFVFYGLASLLLPIGFTATLFIIGMTFLGMGNGVVFQLVPQCFCTEIGVATGLVGAFGGIGGFLLPKCDGRCEARSPFLRPWLGRASWLRAHCPCCLRTLAAFDSDWRNSWAVMGEAEPASAAVGMP